MKLVVSLTLLKSESLANLVVLGGCAQNASTWVGNSKTLLGHSSAQFKLMFASGGQDSLLHNSES